MAETPKPQSRRNPDDPIFILRRRKLGEKPMFTLEQAKQMGAKLERDLRSRREKPSG